LKQEKQQNSIQIPIQYIKSDLIEFDKKTDKTRQCLVCKRLFHHDLSSTFLCPDCDYQKHHPLTTHPVVLRRSPPTNYNTTVYSNSDFVTPFSSSSKIRGPSKIICPRCRNLNLVNNTNDGAIYACSICRTVLHI